MGNVLLSYSLSTCIFGGIWQYLLR